MTVQNILELFQNRQPQILELIREIVEIESPSYDETGNRAAVDFLTREAEMLSCVSKIERIYREGFGEHLIIRAFESNEKPIFLLGHTDTVHPRGSFIQNPTRIEEDVFYGCGVFDMKANCILMLEVLRALDAFDLKPARPINILLSCDEEIGSDTGREFVEQEARTAAFCLVCEPSANGRVKTGRKGTAGYTIKTHGIPAHAGLEPEKGASSILEMVLQIPKIHALADSSKGTTVNVCQIQGGTAPNVIPEFTECTVDVRFTVATEAARIDQAIRQLESSDLQVKLLIEGKINRPPLERTEQVNALYNLAEQIAQSFDYQLGETQVGGASDGNFVGVLGVPVLDGLGIKGSGAHTHQEHIVISDIAPRATLMTKLLLSL